MDFSGFISIRLAAVITACSIIGAAVFAKRGSGLRGPFLPSYGFGVIFMEPWRIAAWQDIGMFAVMLVMLVLWVAGGCLVGAVPAALIVSVISKLRRRSER